eukprot:TRINITY_DN132_c0_g4_i1.p1 TRINITY_DN132_c0_g4~~TRINITY_DN132_c0_g4_i1.p1  ORF type:complete len:517 (+),score=60.88 TRINITY_DN132_c0_g4_i1:101-1651(+)
MDAAQEYLKAQLPPEEERLKFSHIICPCQDCTESPNGDDRDESFRDDSFSEEDGDLPASVKLQVRKQLMPLYAAGGGQGVMPRPGSMTPVNNTRRTTASIATGNRDVFRSLTPVRARPFQSDAQRVSVVAPRWATTPAPAAVAPASAALTPATAAPAAALAPAPAAPAALASPRPSTPLRLARPSSRQPAASWQVYPALNSCSCSRQSASLSASGAPPPVATGSVPSGQQVQHHWPMMHLYASTRSPPAAFATVLVRKASPSPAQSARPLGSRTPTLSLRNVSKAPTPSSSSTVSTAASRGTQRSPDMSTRCNSTRVSTCTLLRSRSSSPVRVPANERSPIIVPRPSTARVVPVPAPRPMYSTRTAPGAFALVTKATALAGTDAAKSPCLVSRADQARQPLPSRQASRQQVSRGRDTPRTSPPVLSPVPGSTPTLPPPVLMQAEPVAACGRQEGKGPAQTRRVSNHRRRSSVGGEVVEAKAATAVAALREVLGEATPEPKVMAPGPVTRTASYGGA